MTPRSIRRATERKIQKQARKEALRLNESAILPAFEPESFAIEPESFAVEPEELAVESTQSPAPSQISAAQLSANRHNAKLSTGPKSIQGKTKVSVNAVKTGLTGRTVLLPSDDAAAYEKHVRRFLNAFSPANENETDLVQRITDTQWRLYRIPEIEAGIYTMARIEFADLFASHPPAEAAALIQAHTFMTHQKQLMNLSLQESRLSRQFSRDVKELRELQDQRRQSERRAAAAALAGANPAAKVQPKIAAVTPYAATDGFEFSTVQNRPNPTSQSYRLATLGLTKAA